MLSRPPPGHRMQFDQLGRREFITLLGGAAAAWPLAARAQQRERVRRIGVLTAFASDDPANQRRVLAFAQALAQSGWTEGRNIRIDVRWGARDPERIRRYAAELVALAPDVILAVGSPSTGPLLQASRAIPIVFVLVADPVGAGFVETLARPGGNATGFMLYEYGFGGKWLELLKEIAPGVRRKASGVRARSHHSSRGWPVWRDPGLGSIARGGGAPDQHARCRRDRACHYCIRAARERRPDRGGRRGFVFRSRCDHQAGRPAPAARTLLGPCVRHRGWPDRLWT